MFDAQSGKRIRITLTLVDGRTMIGAIASGLSASVAATLNREGLFLEFIADSGGETIYIAKSSIAMVREGAVAKTIDLPALGLEHAAR
ncbi:hypothetical protein [Alsobacter sp. SYSU BS001988]|jgi:hypothetical protein